MGELVMQKRMMHLHKKNQCDLQSYFFFHFRFEVLTLNSVSILNGKSQENEFCDKRKLNVDYDFIKVYHLT